MRFLESPAMESSPVLSPMPNSLPYPVKFLHDNIVSLVQGVDNGSAGLVEDGVSPYSPRREPFEPHIRGGGAFLLKRAPNPPIVPPHMLYRLPLTLKPL